MLSRVYCTFIYYVNHESMTLTTPNCQLNTHNYVGLGLLQSWVLCIFHQDKCTRYWPAQGSEEYGSVQVSLVQQAAHGTYNSSTLHIQASGGEVRTVTHYRLTFWPHQGVPKDTKCVTEFLRYFH